MGEKTEKLLLAAALDDGAILRQFLRRRLKQDSDVDDLLQEVYVRLLSTRADTIEDPSRYLLAVAKQVMAERRTRLQKSAAQELSEPVVTAEASDDGSQDLLVEQSILGAIRTLPDTSRLILLLRLEGHTFAEIAKQLHVSSGRVRRSLSSARAQLSSQLWPVGERGQK